MRALPAEARALPGAVKEQPDGAQALPDGTKSFSIGNFSMSFEDGSFSSKLTRKSICPTAYGVLLEAGLLYKGVEGRLPWGID